MRKVYDPDTGRQRLVRGDGEAPPALVLAPLAQRVNLTPCELADAGEIIEEIVSRDRQREINAAATAEDGATFQRTVGLLKDPS